MSTALDRVVVRWYRLPHAVLSAAPMQDHTLTIDAIDLVTCEVETAEGAGGVGYTYTLSMGGSTVFTLLADEIAPILLGQTFDRPEPVWHDVWRRLLRFGRGGLVSVALAAADVALWDLCARAAGLPLYRYLGAFRESVPVYGSSIDLGYSRTQLVETMQGWTSRGFSAVKMKVGHTAEVDRARLAAVRDAIGSDTVLMVDANNGWDLPVAGRRITAMADFDLTWVEEPLLPDDISGHAQLQRQSGVSIAAGETLFSVADFTRYLDADAIRYVQADVGRVGGITPWMAVATLAAAHHVPMAPHFLQDLHVHLLCAAPTASYLEYLPLLDAVMAHPLDVVAGHARPSDEPGTGVRFSSEVLGRHLVSERVVRADAAVGRQGARDE